MGKPKRNACFVKLPVGNKNIWLHLMHELRLLVVYAGVDTYYICKATQQWPDQTAYYC